MDTSKFLAKALGIYLFILSMAMLINMNYFMANIMSVIINAPLMFVAGFFTLILGILMVISHNVWQLNWRIIITIMSWLTLLKGMNLVFNPHVINKMTLLFMQNRSVAYGTAWIDLFLALILSYYGCRKKLVS